MWRKWMACVLRSLGGSECFLSMPTLTRNTTHLRCVQRLALTQDISMLVCGLVTSAGVGMMTRPVINTHHLQSAICPVVEITQLCVALKTCWTSTKQVWLSSSRYFGHKRALNPSIVRKFQYFWIPSRFMFFLWILNHCLRSELDGWRWI